MVSVTLLIAVLGLTWRVQSQEMEARAYSVSPVGTNIVLLSYGRATGDLNFDPSLPITDGKATINSASAGYVRSINFFGRSANVGMILPYAWGNLQGNVAGQFQAVRRSGLRDPMVRFAVNLHGARAMDLKEFITYRQKTNIGASIIVAAPLGQYDPAKAVNLSANRWGFKPEVGISRAVRRMYLDVYGSAWLFTANHNFQGRTRKQDPIVGAQFHLSYVFNDKMWAAFDGTVYTGGRTVINGVRGNDLQRNSRIGGTFSYKLDRRQSLKFVYSKGVITTIGGDFQSVTFGYQYLWGRGL
ncbi:MAG: transporter [Pyrinomonadaceae bacterium]|nr:transporter [Pyrinomonadaceae bacterium]